MYFIDCYDGDWCVVPADRREEWLTWMENQQDDGLEVPEYVEYLGHPNLVEFPSYEVL